MAFGSGFSDFFNGVYQGLTHADDLKDYRHASRLFLSDGYALAPQTKFLFHVYFTLNTAEIPGLRSAFGSIQDISTIGMMVKSADLPKFNVDIQEYNQYNRKRYVQNKINYQPVSISFHDDGSDLVRSMWNAYYTYYYQDSLYKYDNVTSTADLSQSSSPIDFNRRDIYDNLRSINDWGYNESSPSGGYKPNFFKDIKIYGLNRGNFTQYTLINPVIADWSHDNFDYSNGGGTMTNTMTVRYETVKYARGKVGTTGDSNVKGFGDPAFYDDEPSMFGKAGSVASITGPGGLVEAGSSIIDDLASGNILGAGVTALTSYETFKDFDFGAAAKAESGDILTSVLVGAASSPLVTNTLNSMVFPTSNTNTPNNKLTTNSNNGLTSSVTNTSPTNSSWINPDTNYVSQAVSAADVNSNGAPVNKNWVNPDDFLP